MAVVESFFTPAEAELSRAFLGEGYVIRPVAEPDALDELRAAIVKLTCTHLKLELPADHGMFLDTIHQRIAPQDLQNRVNLSIQMSNDDSSLLDIHSDVYGGETPFQVVQWLPLVSVAGRKSMFFLPQAKSKEVARDMKSLGDMRKLFDRVKNDLIWLDIPYGSVLVFDSSCLHGNVVNDTETTRWSLNCRFTGLFTPYTSYEKKLGSFYLPITTRAASRIGMRYEQPGGFEE